MYDYKKTINIIKALCHKAFWHFASGKPVLYQAIQFSSSCTTFHNTHHYWSVIAFVQVVLPRVQDNLMRIVARPFLRSGTVTVFPDTVSGSPGISVSEHICADATSAAYVT